MSIRRHARGHAARWLVVCVAGLMGISWAVAGAAGPGSPATLSPLLIARARGTSTIYLVGSVKCRRSLCLELLRTNDTGATFERKAMPPVAPVKGSEIGNLVRLAFANANDGYALLGSDRSTTLYVTTDGARSWHKEQIAPDVSVYSFAVTPDSVYAITVRCPGVDMNCVDYRVDRSNLAAVHWTSTALPHSNFYPGGFVGQLGAYGTDVWVSEQLAAPAYVYFSSNSARTFTRWVEPELGSVSGCDLTAMSAMAMWAECPTGMMVSFLHSNDGGRQWAPVSPQPMAGTGGGDFDPVSADFAFIDYGIIAHNLYRLGTTVAAAARVGELKCDDATLAFTDESDGLALCTQNFSTWALERTTDGGATWHIVLPDRLRISVTR